MNKQDIIQSLKQNHQKFANEIQALTSDEFLFRKGEKWTAGQQADHIVKSISPVVMAFGLPRFVPKLMFGKSNRPSRNYEELIEKYNVKLAKGGKASGRFVPKEVGLQQQYYLPKQIMHYTNQLCKQVEKMSDQELNTLLLPHPLLGKLTFKEMLYFTAYHVEHHSNILKRDLGK